MQIKLSRNVIARTPDILVKIQEGKPADMRAVRKFSQEIETEIKNISNEEKQLLSDNGIDVNEDGTFTMTPEVSDEWNAFHEEKVYISEEVEGHFNRLQKLFENYDYDVDQVQLFVLDSLIDALQEASTEAEGDK